MSSKLTSAAAGTTPSPASGDDGETRANAAFLAGQDPVDVAAAAWLFRRQEGLDAEAEAAFQGWLATDPAHGKALAQLETIWGRLGDLPKARFAGLKGAVAGPPRSASPPPSRQTPRQDPRQTGARTRSDARWRWAGLLGPALALTILAAGWFGWQHWQQMPVYESSFTTARGQHSEVALPDGSRLWLDTASRADVRLFRQRREVRLPEGQVQFAVQGDPARPFDVDAGPVRITVVGTRFSVRLTQTGLVEGEVNVQVEEGRVRVARRDEGEGRGMAAGRRDSKAAPVELVAGQTLTAGQDGPFTVVTAGAAGARPAWREGRVSFNAVPLARALAEFERYGDTRLVIHDPAVSALRVNGSFDLRRLDAFTRALPQVLPVRLRQKDGLTEIVASGRP